MSGSVGEVSAQELLANVERERRRLEAILRQMPALILVIDASGRIMEANERCLELLGRSADEVLGCHFAEQPVTLVDDAGDVIPPDALPSARALGGEDVTAEVGLVRSDGVRWIHVSAAPIRDEHGAVEGAVLILRDQTSRREMMTALRASEAQNRILLDAIPDSLYRVDRNGVVLDRRAPHDDRIRLHEVYVGRTLSDLLNAQIGAKLTAAVQASIATGEARALEYSWVRGDGAMHREARIVPMDAEQALMLVRDIGDRKQAEAEEGRLNAQIETERRRLDAILRQVPHSLLVVNRDGRIDEINDALLETIGRDKSEVLGRRLDELGQVFRDEAGQPLPLQALPASRALRGEEVEGSISVQVKSGQTIWLQASAAPIRDDRGEIVGAVTASRNVTAERAALAALRESEERNRALLDAIPDSIFVMNRDVAVLEVKAPRDGRPWRPQFRQGFDLRTLLPPDLFEILAATIREALDTGMIQTREFVMPTPDGPRHREARVVPCGQDRVLALVRDIEARKRAEQEREGLLATIDHERRRLAAVLRQIPNSLLVLDADARIVELNDHVLTTLGLSKDEALGRRSGEIGRRYLDPNGRPLTLDELPSRCALRGEEVHRELRATASDGTQSWITVSAAPIRDEHGAIAGAIVATRDITAERDAREALRLSEERTRALLDAIPDSIYVNDRDGLILDHKPPSDGRPMQFRMPLAGKRVQDLWPEETASFVLGFTHKALDTGEQQVLEYQVPTRAGLAYREVRVVPYGTNAILALVRDIDARKRAELALQALNQQLEERVQERTAELQAANAELEAFSYSVSHDLKAPLRGIDGYSQLLWEDYADQLDDEGQILLKNVREGAAQMYRLIDDLLAYSRLERRVVDDAPVDLNAILEGLLAERAAEIERRGVRVHLAVPPMTAQADLDGFAQAVRNLLDNALRFTADHPEPCIEIGGEVDAARCTLWVRDNGIGFDMRYHDRIFEIFQRLHRQEEYPGTGIGLALVRKAMQRMRGRAWAESAPGAGATFYLELPR